MHGIPVPGLNVSGSYEDFDNAVEWIAAAHPGTLTLALDVFNGQDAFTPLWEQIDSISATIYEFIDENKEAFQDGFHLLCHSQGTLICRGLIETNANFGVENFVSLAGVHMGQYGGSNVLLTRNIYKVFYTPEAQKLLSISSYWHDPLHETFYLNTSVFLPQLNNIQLDPDYKTNFLSINATLLTGSPDDSVIMPWQSSFFGFYEVNSTRTILPYTQQDVYLEDTFGLRSLDTRGGLVLNQQPGVTHQMWLTDQSLFDEVVLPWLT